jgi:hypothetical protein
MGMGQVLTMPLFFASNAIYPISLMPTWLQIISHINPLTYVRSEASASPCRCLFRRLLPPVPPYFCRRIQRRSSLTWLVRWAP